MLVKVSRRSRCSYLTSFERSRCVRRSGIVVYVVFIIYIMQDLTYIYHTPTEDVTITGFIAYLLQQGDAWDMRCLEADAREYHALQYTRMHPTIALKQELQWWLDCALDEWL